MNAPQLNGARAAHDLQSLESEHPIWFTKAFEVARDEGSVMSDGALIHYFRWGDPGKPGVVLTHGFMAHARCWAFVAPLLAERYCLAAFDLSGMGDSDWRPSYDLSLRARETKAVAEAAGMTTGGRRPALVCHSYGGSVGIAAAQADPDDWASLVVCDMTMLAPGEESQFQQGRLQRAGRETRPHRVYPDFATARSRFRLAPDQPCENDYLVEYMARHSLKKDRGGWVWKFDPTILGMNDQRDPDWWQSIASRFAELSLPRGIIYGEHSEMFSDRAAAFVREHTADTIPMVPIPDAHHHIMLDQPIAFAAAIDTQLQLLGR